jgi:hypothetical protein
MQDRSTPARRIFLLRTAGPYIWVKTRHDAPKSRCLLYPQKRTFIGVNGMSPKCQKQTFNSPRTKKTSEHCPQSGRLFAMPDKDFVDYVEHANSKLLWHWCEPWGAVQSRPGIGEPLLPSRFHGRAAELEIL